MKVAITLSVDETPISAPDGQYYTTSQTISVEDGLDPLNKTVEEEAIKRLRHMFSDLRKERNRSKMAGLGKQAKE